MFIVQPTENKDVLLECGKHGDYFVACEDGRKRTWGREKGKTGGSILDSRDPFTCYRGISFTHASVRYIQALCTKQADKKIIEFNAAPSHQVPRKWHNQEQWTVRRSIIEKTDDSGRLRR